MTDDKNFDITTEGIPQEVWLILIYSLITDFPAQEWDEFVHDLIYDNRFSSSHRVVDVIKGYAERCTKIIKKDQLLYRARIYHQDPLKEFLSDVFKNADMKKDKLASDQGININDYYNMQLAALVMAVEKGTQRGKEIIDSYNKWKRKRFKGYSASESGMPPADKVFAGRINPERIRYLYLAEDPHTTVYEVRPTIGQHVSVATFKTTEEIRVYDLTEEINLKVKEYQDDDHALFEVIRQRFSEPNTGNVYKYLPTQYLSEIIKLMGFDGLRFKSSLKNSGINVVLFNDKKCKSVRSDIIRVGDIELKFDNPEIYQLEEYLNFD